MYDAQDLPMFMIRPDTCCGDCLPVCGSGGFGKSSSCIYMPFYIRTFDTLEKLPGGASVDFPGGGMEAQIRNVWPGFKRECCTSADNCDVRAGPSAARASHPLSARRVRAHAQTLSSSPVARRRRSRRRSSARRSCSISPSSRRRMAAAASSRGKRRRAQLMSCAHRGGGPSAHRDYAGSTSGCMW